jgi:hypothetical protein
MIYILIYILDELDRAGQRNRYLSYDQDPCLYLLAIGPNHILGRSAIARPLLNSRGVTRTFEKLAMDSVIESDIDCKPVVYMWPSPL